MARESRLEKSILPDETLRLTVEGDSMCAVSWTAILSPLTDWIGAVPWIALFSSLPAWAAAVFSGIAAWRAGESAKLVIAQRSDLTLPKISVRPVASELTAEWTGFDSTVAFPIVEKAPRWRISNIGKTELLNVRVIFELYIDFESEGGWFVSPLAPPTGCGHTGHKQFWRLEEGKIRAGASHDAVINRYPVDLPTANRVEVPTAPVFGLPGSEFELETPESILNMLLFGVFFARYWPHFPMDEAIDDRFVPRLEVHAIWTNVDGTESKGAIIAMTLVVDSALMTRGDWTEEARRYTAISGNTPLPWEKLKQTLSLRFTPPLAKKI